MPEYQRADLFVLQVLFLLINCSFYKFNLYILIPKLVEKMLRNGDTSASYVAILANETDRIPLLLITTMNVAL